MRDFNRERSGGGRSFGKHGFGGNRQTSRPQMYNAICSNCGKECQVPFKPTGEKPVYCRDCFTKINGEDSRKNFGRNDRNERPTFRTFNHETRNQSMPDQQMKDINIKLDKILALLEHDTQKVAQKAQGEKSPTEIEIQVPPQNEDKHTKEVKQSSKKKRIVL